MSRSAGASTIAPIQRSLMRRDKAIPRVSRSTGPVFPNAAPEYTSDVTTWKASIPLRNGALLVLQVRVMREDLLAVEVLRPHAG